MDLRGLRQEQTTTTTTTTPKRCTSYLTQYPASRPHQCPVVNWVILLDRLERKVVDAERRQHDCPDKPIAGTVERKGLLPGCGDLLHHPEQTRVHHRRLPRGKERLRWCSVCKPPTPQLHKKRKKFKRLRICHNCRTAMSSLNQTVLGVAGHHLPLRHVAWGHRHCSLRAFGWWSPL